MCNLGDGIEKKARKQGIEEGRVEGRAEGRAEGMAEERSSGIRKLIVYLRSFNLPDGAIRQQVISQYGDVDLSKYF